jgi:acetyltransferase
MIRRLRPEDEVAYAEFCGALDREDLRLRFGRPVGGIEPACIERMLQRGKAEEIAIAMFAEGVILGVARLVLGDEPEFAVVVRPGAKRRGVATALLGVLIGIARARRVPALRAYVLAENRPMLTLARRLGFHGIAAEGPLLTLELLVMAPALAA